MSDFEKTLESMDAQAKEHANYEDDLRYSRYLDEQAREEHQREHPHSTHISEPAEGCIECQREDNDYASGWLEGYGRPDSLDGDQ